MTYQQAMGAENSAVEDHRGTYGVAAAQWKAWFDEF